MMSHLRRSVLVGCIAFFPVLPAAAGITVEPAFTKASDAGFGNVPELAFGALDRALLAAEDALSEGRGEPARFAVARATHLRPEVDGVWDRSAEGSARWRQRISAAGAPHLNFGFTRFRMPTGGRLEIFAADGSSYIGPFTAEHNQAAGELWTPIIKASDVVLQVTLPEAERGALELTLGAVNQGYRGFGTPMGPDKSGACNVDVICPEGNAYRDIIRSVARITIGGQFLCSGAMINNTAQDFKPLFLTAAHCGISSGNAASVVSYWLFENTTCRTPGSFESGSDGSGSLSKSISGTIHRATYQPADTTLLELSQAPPSDYRVFWAGWDRTGGNPNMAIAIHHPQGDEKRISFENQALSTSSYLGNSSPGDGTHLRVADWDLGTTEGGSSGSPLFNSNKRIVGELHGGFAACGNDSADWYGRLSVAWGGGGTASTRLSDWLDPVGTGVNNLGGTQPGSNPPPTVNAPSNLQGVPQSITQVLLSWTDNSTNETQFRIEVRPQGGNYTDVGSVGANVTSAVVSGLTPGTTYQLRVRARAGSTNSAYSNVVTVTLGGGAPQPPRNLKADPVTQSAILLSWEDRSSNENGFEIQRRTIGQLNNGTNTTFFFGPFTTVATLGGGEISYLDDEVISGVIYNYRVRAFNGSGASPFAAEAPGTANAGGAPFLCTEGGKYLCVLGDRFRIEGFWNNFRQTNVRGEANAIPNSDQTGFFWFFSPSNVELVVKMLNGVPVTSFFWTFYGALSDVEYWIVVTDTLSGTRRAYYNAPTNICGVGDTRSIPGGSSFTGSAAAPEPRRLAALEFEAGDDPAPDKGGSCVPSSQRLCLLGNRFAATVTYRNQHAGGATGSGGVVAGPSTDQTGFFFFFDPANIELVVKMINGTAVNGKFWVFFGALSDLEYTLTVTDTATGASKQYHNAPGNICGGADTGAL